MTNAKRWALTIALAAMGGVVQCASSSHDETWKDYLRSAVIGAGPAVAALQMTLQKNQDKPGDGK